MNVYHIHWKRYNEDKYLTVAAKNITKAVEDVKRYIKKNYYDSDPEIVNVELSKKIDVFYKS